MRGNFTKSLGFVLKSEGGFSNDPRDPGGATNQGITQVVYDDWRRARGLPPRSVKLLDFPETKAIYKGRYWDTVKGDDLPSGVDYCVFDFAVNSGPVRAARYLQRAAGVADDGLIGPISLGAISARDAKHLIDKICDGRLEYLESLPTFDHFGHGWINRVAAVRAQAEAMT